MNEITFNHSHSGALDLLPGCTDWSSIPAIFALDATFQRDQEHLAVYATDEAGLVLAAKAANNAAGALSDAIAVIGKLLAAADHDHIAAHDFSAVGWLLNGLGDLQSDLLVAAANMRYSLEHDGYLERAEEGSDHG